jgi:hypothetical protein
MNRLFRQERLLCTNRRNILKQLAVMSVPAKFLVSKDDVTILAKGRYMVRWYDESTGKLILKDLIRSFGPNPRKSEWREFRNEWSTERKRITGAPEGVPASRAKESQPEADA